MKIVMELVNPLSNLNPNDIGIHIGSERCVCRFMIWFGRAANGVVL
ncbi:hypothetical protein NXY40_21730 [Phocaeicola vulgatus]|nr:hypothetical protein [Phocaeicola vulgatus]